MPDPESLRSLLDRQVELIEAGDLDGLIDQYDEEAVLVRFDRIARGREEIRGVMGPYLELGPKLVSLDAFAEFEDALSYQATMSIGERTVRAYGAFVLRNGKIWRQFAGIMPA